MKPNDVLDFWESIGNKGWWTKNEDIDAQIHDRFGELHAQACEGTLDHWTQTPDGALALVIVLDQFSRNLFRGSAKSSAQDAKALEIAKALLNKGHDKQCRQDLRIFFYLPFEHSESILDQEKSVLLQLSITLPGAMKAALEHREIIKRFSRFPHRNKALGRHTTPAERAYLDKGGFKG